MTNSGDRAECPACLSVTAEVAAAQDARRPCPHCSLPFDLIGPVQDARNGKLPQAIVDALIQYGQLSEIRQATVTRLEGALREAQHEAIQQAGRAATLHGDVVRVQQEFTEYQATVGKDLDRARWRLGELQDAHARALAEPFPEALR